jgi:hypothetical protein
MYCPSSPVIRETKYHSTSPWIFFLNEMYNRNLFPLNRTLRDLGWTQNNCNISFRFSAVCRSWSCRSKCTKLKQSGSAIHEVVENHTALPHFGHVSQLDTSWDNWNWGPRLLRVHTSSKSRTVKSFHCWCTGVLPQPVELCLQVSNKFQWSVVPAFCAAVSQQGNHVCTLLPCCPCCNEVNKIAFSEYECTQTQLTSHSACFLAFFAFLPFPWQVCWHCCRLLVAVLCPLPSRLLLIAFIAMQSHCILQSGFKHWSHPGVNELGLSCAFLPSWHISVRLTLRVLFGNLLCFITEKNGTSEICRNAWEAVAECILICIKIFAWCSTDRQLPPLPGSTAPVHTRTRDHTRPDYTPLQTSTISALAVSASTDSLAFAVEGARVTKTGARSAAITGKVGIHSVFFWDFSLTISWSWI